MLSSNKIKPLTDIQRKVVFYKQHFIRKTNKYVFYYLFAPCTVCKTNMHRIILHYAIISIKLQPS